MVLLFLVPVYETIASGNIGHNLTEINIYKQIIFKIFLKGFIYLFRRDTERERERGRDTRKGRSRLPAGSPSWDLIPVSRIMPSAEGG